MSQQLDNLIQQVKANGDAEAAAVALIQGLAAQIEAAKDDPAKLQELVDSLKSQDDALAAAISANTPTDAAQKAGGGQFPGVQGAQGMPSSSGHATGIYSGAYSEGGQNPSPKPAPSMEAPKDTSKKRG